MPKKPVDEDRVRRRAALEQKRAARKVAKEQEEKALKEAAAASQKKKEATPTNAVANSKTAGGGECLLFSIPEVSLRRIYTFLSSADLGRTILTCRSLNKTLDQARATIVLSRLKTKTSALVTTQEQAEVLLSDSLRGDTGRVITKKWKERQMYNQFPGYLRFLEESVTGYSTLKTGKEDTPILLPKFVKGSMVSCSPEHSLCRNGGDGTRHGPGGSGVASWGVGKRGQLGHGKRQDERFSRRLLHGIGYGVGGVRIVQVSAGGGLVRVAHSLLLTSHGRVLSFGTGQYGALGHGYSAAKQLPDCLHPTYIDALAHVQCVCVSAGELHSAAVTADGDVYTWGDGFCGQLGHGDKRPQVTPRQVTVGGLEDECVANVTCGSRHTLAVTDDGDCYSWGLGHFGVLGRSYTPFEYDADAAVVALATADGVVNDNEEDEAAVRRGAVRIDVDRPAPPPPPVGAAEELRARLDLIANLSLEDSSDQCIPMVIDSLQGIKLVGASAGHRHSLFLDNNGWLYSSGAGRCGCLGVGDTQSQMFPCRIQSFDDDNIRIRQMSAGVDMSMAVSTTGDVYGWGKTDNGRIGLGNECAHIALPRRVALDVKAVDVECGYVHSLVVGLEGSVWSCGVVGVEGEADGQHVENMGHARKVDDMNIWHRTLEPQKEQQPKKERWKKYGKYEVKGRSRALD